MTSRALLLGCVFLFLSAGAFAQTASDSNVSAKLTGNLVPHTQTGRALRIAPSTPCGSAGTSLTTAGTPGVVYDLFVQLQNVTVATPPDAVEFWIDYDLATSDKGLEIIGWESFAGAEIRHSNARGEDWPAPGSGITLVFGEESPVTRASLDPSGQGSRGLGRFLVQANGDAALSFTTTPPITKAVPAPSPSAVTIHDSEGFQTLASPDNIGTISFGKEASYNPCNASSTSLEVNSAEIELGTRSLSVRSLRNPSEARVQWTVASSKERTAKVTLYSVSGRLVKRWDSVNLIQGNTRLVWDGFDESGSKSSAGVYYLEVTSNDGFRVVTKAVLMRQ